MPKYSRYYPGATPRSATVEAVLPPREIREDTTARRAWLAEKLRELTLAGRSAKITGKGSYQQISVKIEREVETVEQLRGVCQICGGRWAIVGDTIAHHGYKRPGGGWQTSSCGGARYVPLAESCDRATSVAMYIAEYQIPAAELGIETMRTAVRVTDVRTKRTGGRSEKLTVVLRPSDGDEFVRVRNARVALLEQELKWLRETHAALTERCAAFARGEFVGSTKLERVAR